MISIEFWVHCLLVEFCISSRCVSAGSETIFSTIGLLLGQARLPVVLRPEALADDQQQVEDFEDCVAERVVFSVFEVQQQDAEHLLSAGYLYLVVENLQDGAQVRAEEEVLDDLESLQLNHSVGLRQEVYQQLEKGRLAQVRDQVFFRGHDVRAQPERVSLDPLELTFQQFGQPLRHSGVPRAAPYRSAAGRSRSGLKSGSSRVGRPQKPPSCSKSRASGPPSTARGSCSRP